MVEWSRVRRETSRIASAFTCPLFARVTSKLVVQCMREVAISSTKSQCPSLERYILAANTKEASTYDLPMLPALILCVLQLFLACTAALTVRDATPLQGQSIQESQALQFPRPKNSSSGHIKAGHTIVTRQVGRVRSTPAAAKVHSHHHADSLCP